LLSGGPLGGQPGGALQVETAPGTNETTICNEELFMNKAQEKANLMQVKLKLAEKCDRLAKVSKSKPKQRTLIHQADKFRRQAADLSR
jgi:hypothetical protein